jgi:hypothetical protein
MTAEFASIDFRKILKHQIPLKSVLWEPSCFMRTETDGQIDIQTDTTKLIVALRLFARTSKNDPAKIES